MTDDMVMRSVYLRPAEDMALRRLAHELNVTKSDLIRSAISVKLLEWLDSNERQTILADLEHGRRDEAAIRSGPKGRRRGRGDGNGALLMDSSRRGEVAKAQAPEEAASAEAEKTGGALV